MMDKPKDIAGYTPDQTERAEQILLEVWSRLADYHNYLVLVGGLVPRYLVPQSDRQIPRHCGTLDVDLGVSLAIADVKAYSSIRQSLERIGLHPDINERGNERKHSFLMESDAGPIVVDFLTTNYDGPDSVVRAVESQLSAVQVEGMGLALEAPLEVPIQGPTLLGGITSATVRVSRPVPFIVLKALAFHTRLEGKDANDLVYVLRYADRSPAAVAGRVTDYERKSDAFIHALNTLKADFESPSHTGPARYARFLPNEPDAPMQAFAAVQEFLTALSKGS